MNVLLQRARLLRNYCEIEMTRDGGMLHCAKYLPAFLRNEIYSIRWLFIYLNGRQCEWSVRLLSPFKFRRTNWINIEFGVLWLCGSLLGSIYNPISSHLGELRTRPPNCVSFDEFAWLDHVKSPMRKCRHKSNDFQCLWFPVMRCNLVDGLLRMRSAWHSHSRIENQFHLHHTPATLWSSAFFNQLFTVSFDWIHWIPLPFNGHISQEENCWPAPNVSRYPVIFVSLSIQYCTFLSESVLVFWGSLLIFIYVSFPPFVGHRENVGHLITISDGCFLYILSI